MSIHKIADGIFKVRWREGGETEASAFTEATNWRAKLNGKKCRFGMRIGIST